MLVTIGSYDICNGTTAGGVAVGQLRFGVDRQIEIVVPLSVANPETFDLAGRITSLTFQVQRTHASAGAAELFIASLDSLLPSSGNVILTFTTTGTQWHIPNGKIRSHNSNQTGATTTTSYTIVGGQAGSGAS